MCNCAKQLVSICPTEIITRLNDNAVRDLLFVLEHDVEQLMDCLLDTDDDNDYNPLVFDVHYRERKIYVSVDIYNNGRKKFDTLAKLHQNTRIAENIIMFDLNEEWEEQAFDFAYERAQQTAPDKVYDRNSIAFNFSYSQNDGLMLEYVVYERKVLNQTKQEI